MNTVEEDARRYRLLTEYLLKKGYIAHHPVTVEDSEPFVMRNDFYGPALDVAIDTLG